MAADSSSNPERRRPRGFAPLAALAVFLATFTTYSLSTVTPQADSIWSLYVAESFARTGNFDLDEYASLGWPDDYRVVQVNGHRQSYYPIGAPMLAAPIVGLLEGFPVADGMPLSKYLASHRPDAVVFQLEKNIASFLAALNCVVIFALARQQLGDVKSLLITGIFAFATSVWSVGSRGLWQHGPSMLCLSLALYFLGAAKGNPSRAALAGLPLAFSFVVRPTNAISIVLFTAYVWIVYRRYFGYYALCFAAILIPYAAHNYATYASLLPPYYGLKLQAGPEFAAALVGNLVSPARGVLLFSPIFILSILGFYYTVRSSGAWLGNLGLYVFGAIVLHWVTISVWGVWWGGVSVGPRIFSDVTPFFVYLLAPVVDKWSWPSRGALASGAGTVAFVILLSFSIFAHARSAIDPRPSAWNWEPNNVDQTTARLWDWSDILFLRGLCPNGEMEAPRCWR
jgi:hypothetical protein